MKDSDQSIRLTTVHQAKGLEYDIVFVIGAAEGLFPIRRAVESGDTEEERRLFYVAVTRARDELYLLYPKMNTKGGGSMFLTPSRFIQEVSQDLYEPVRIRRNYGW
jgi:DNA helicase-2/ATP-dependent DNA helicase PcrA